MITFIIGDNGTGKTALATYFLQEKYINEGEEILRKSCELIRETNAELGTNYSLPDKVPFYTANFRAKLHVGYKEYYEPYFLNGYYFGVANEEMDTQFVPPFSVLVFDEAQRIFNSRESSTFPEFVSYAFEIHRHARLDITLIAQRGMLIDCNIREVGVHVIEVVSMENEKDIAGNIFRSTWHCREFDDWSSAEAYLKSGEKTYKETTYTNEGSSIYASYNSFDKLTAFLPPKGKDFSYLPYEKPADVSEREAKFYNTARPKEYRSKPKLKAENKTKGRDTV